MAGYDHKKIEAKWADIWAKTELYKTRDDAKGEKLYHLVMFPYPSGDMHIGHWYNYSGADFRARLKKMQGYNVLSPIGFDAFGLPAENAAIKRGIAPAKWTYSNIENMKKQLSSMGTVFDPSREVITSDPEYYKWTQWFFLFMYKNGLAYKKKVTANWCPSCATVLANEQVVAGKCERCDTEVEQRKLEQWLFKITDYAEDLITGLEKIDWPEKTKTMQKNWIGRSEGAEVKFETVDKEGKKQELWVFTTRPDTLFGVTFMVLAPEHPLVEKITTDDHADEVKKYLAKTLKKTELERQEGEKSKTGVFTGAYAINPANGEKIPVWISDYVLMTYGHGAIMAVPAHDERDFEFAKKFELPVKEVVEPLFYNRSGGEDAFRPDAPVTERNAVVGVVKHWSEDKYIGIKWLVNDWQGFNIGGIEAGETAAETGLREITEEIGYKNVELVKDYGKAVHSKFFQMGKKENRFAHFYPVLYKLKSDEKTKVVDEEKALHEELWLTPKEMENFLNREDMRWIWNGIVGEKLFSGDGIAVNSEKYNGLETAEVKNKIIGDLEKEGKARFATTYRLRDWLISRQRYWGAPIPMVTCKNCGEVPVPEQELPVMLPENVEFKPTGESPLKSDESFVNTKCPTCGGAAKRETDTMDTFVCSSWYFFRYVDPKNENVFAASDKLKTWLPVDMYIGGAEHSVLHLLYSRFFTKVLKDKGYIDFDEPFTALRHQGMILGPNGQKMSKSKGNVVSPDEWVEKVGADTVRMYLGFMGPYDLGGPWNPSSVMGVRRFLDKVWSLFEARIEDTEADLPELRLVNQTLKKVGEDIESLRFNTAVSALMVLVNQISKHKVQYKHTLQTLALMLAPFAPFVAEELWSKMGFRESIHKESWPRYNESYLEEDLVTIVVQVNGKVRANLEMNKNSTQKEVEAAAMQNENVKKFVQEKPKKVIYIPEKILNIVL